MRFRLNKKGGDKIISMYWFAILFIVAAAIVYMVLLFYGKPYDVREVEANLLINKVADCLTSYEGLYFDPFILDNFEENCALNFQVEDFQGWKDDQLYAEVNVRDFSNSQLNAFNPVFFGNMDLKNICKDKLGNVPYCIEKSFYVITSEGTPYYVDVFVSIRKTEKNVR